MTNTKKTPSCQKYPWEEWFLEEELHLIKGQDFDCESYIMAQQIRNAAAKYTICRKDIRVSIYVDQDQVTVYVRT